MAEAPVGALRAGAGTEHPREQLCVLSPAPSPALEALDVFLCFHATWMKSRASHRARIPVSWVR